MDGRNGQRELIQSCLARGWCAYGKNVSGHLGEKRASEREVSCPKRSRGHYRLLSWITRTSPLHTQRYCGSYCNANVRCDVGARRRRRQRRRHRRLPCKRDTRGRQAFVSISHRKREHCLDNYKYFQSRLYLCGYF